LTLEPLEGLSNNWKWRGWNLDNWKQLLILKFHSTRCLFLFLAEDTARKETVLSKLNPSQNFYPILLDKQQV
jgi:hypothetical protein